MIYALKIGNKFRVSTEQIVLTEDDSGDPIKFHYRPSILNLDPFTDQLSLEQGGQAPIPTSKVKISDADLTLSNYLLSKRVQEIPITYIRIDGESVTKIPCSMSDFSSQNGVISFDLRLTEDIVDKEYMSVFTPVTFQWIENPEVLTVRVSPTFSKMPDVPWKIVGADYRRTYATAGRYQEWFTTQGADQPKFGLTPSGINPDDAYMLYTPPSFVSPIYIRDQDFPSSIKASDGYDRIPIANMFQPYYSLFQITRGLSVLNSLEKSWGSHDFDAISKLYSPTNRAEALFQNTRSYYYDFINNIFLQDYGVYAAGTTIDSGIDIPMIHTGKLLLDQGNNTNTTPGYKFAHVGSATEAGFEIIAYCVAGAGIMWVDGSGDWWWRSDGQITTLKRNILEPIDTRMYHLCGIPTVGMPNPLFDMGFTDNEFTDTTGWEFKRDHDMKVPVWPARTTVQGRNQQDITLTNGYKIQRHTFDRLLINSNNFTPDPDLDPEYSSGFVFMNQFKKESTPLTVDLGGNIIDPGLKTNYRLFCRYKIKSLTEDVVDFRLMQDEDSVADSLDNPFTLIEMQIHNRHIDYDNDYGISIASDAASAELPDPGDWRIKKWDRDDEKFRVKPNDTFSPFGSEDDIRDYPVELYQLDFYMGTLVIKLSNLTEDDLIALDPEDFENRYRGLRVDQILNKETLLADISQAVVYSNSGGVDLSGSVSVQEQSSNILNNASERFGVVTSSIIRKFVNEGVTTAFEYLYFHIPEESGYTREVIDDAVDEDVNDVQTKTFEQAKKDYKMYTNRMSYRPTFNTALDQMRDGSNGLQDYGQDEANNYFRESDYRIIHDPVPQNSEDLGKRFPIVYGRVFRAPLMQVISKITLYEDSETAGDDVYIYASHPCDVSNGHDIVVEYDVDAKKTKVQSEDEQRERQRAGLATSVAKSPFPSYEDGHVQVDGVGRRLPRQRLWLPYHSTFEQQALDGRKYQAIRLRGSEWVSGAGKSDKRYPIRNGFGTTPLFATYNGYLDSNGEIIDTQGLIEHPLDFLRHFVKTYGKAPYKDDYFDIESMKRVKQQTPLYRVSIFMNETMTSEEAIAEVCKQFGFYSGKIGHRTFFCLPSDTVNYSKPIIDKLNIVGDISENMDGYKSSVTEVVYKYAYDYPSDSFSETVYLNSENNEGLAKANRVLQNRTTMEVEAKWVADPTTATLVSLSLAKIHSGKRRYFDLTVRVVEGINFELGDLVPLTIKRLLIEEMPCYVVSVKRLESDLVELKLMSLDQDQDVTKSVLTQLSPPVVLPPENLSAPVVTGIAKVGETLTVTNGTWSNL